MPDATPHAGDGVHHAAQRKLPARRRGGRYIDGERIEREKPVPASAPAIAAAVEAAPTDSAQLAAKPRKAKGA